MPIVRNYLFYLMEKVFIMNSIKLAIITTFLTLSVATAEADTANTATPNILSSVSANSIQTLSNTEARKTRGEYRNCYFSFCYNTYLIFQIREIPKHVKLIETYNKKTNWGFFTTNTTIYVSR